MDPHSDRTQDRLRGTPAGSAGGISRPERIGSYELLRELGRGGMGVVYLARDPALDRKVALKVIAAAGFASEADRARFLREAQVAAKLQHPHVVRVHQVGEDAGRLYLAMDHVEGETFERRLEKGDFATHAKVALVAKIAGAVHHLHENGIIHRDLKPQNVMVRPDGEPVLMDFGLARRLEEEKTLTISETVLGTPAYMSPEQAGGETKSLGPATDIYALGAILYRALAGQPPFLGPTAASIVCQVCFRDPTPPQEINREVDRDLATITLKCLAKEPGKRYSSARALAEDLERHGRGFPILARPPSLAERAVRFTRREPAKAGGLAVLFTATVVISILAFLWRGAFQRALVEGERAERALQERSHALDRATLEEMEARAQARRARARLVLFAASEELRQDRPHRALPLAASSYAEDPSPLALGRFSEALGLVRKGGETVAVLRGHEGPVTSAAESPDGKWVVTASYDKTARVWRASGGEPIAVLRGHEGPVTSAAFSPDGKWIVTASWDGTARVWPASGGRPVAVLRGHEKAVSSAAFSPDGKSIVTTSADRTARIWPASGGRPVAVLRGHEEAVYSAAFSPDGKSIVTASLDHTARVWAASGGEPVVVLRGHELAVNAAAFSLDGKWIVTASYDRTARVWPASGGEPVAVLRGHEGWVLSAEFSPDGRWVVTASQDNTARVWPATGGEPVSVLRRHEGVVTSATFSADGKRVLTASLDGTARVEDISRGEPAAVLRGHEEPVRSSAFSPDGNWIVTASDDKTARVWPASGGEPAEVLRGHEGAVNSAAVSPDANWILTASDDKTARVWSASGGEPVWVLRGHEDAVNSAAASPDGKWIVTASKDRTARVWSASGGELVSVLRGHGGAVTSAAFSPDGKRIVTASWDKTAKVWPASGGEPAAVLHGHEGGVLSAAFSPDAKWVVTSSYDKTARVWPASGGEPVAVFRGHASHVSSATFSPDGKWIVTASEDGTARVLDVAYLELGARELEWYARLLSAYQVMGDETSVGLEPALRLPRAVRDELRPSYPEVSPEILEGLAATPIREEGMRAGIRFVLDAADPALAFLALYDALAAAPTRVEGRRALLADELAETDDPHLALATTLVRQAPGTIDREPASRNKDAIATLREALAVAERASPDHPLIAATRRWLGGAEGK